jgi:pyruvate dehydrogenase E1 component
MRARGFLMGATAGRTTLTGEGLQHDDGQSHLLFSVVPNVQAYDPAFAYETAAIVRDGIRRMYGESAEDIFYYITLYNENYVMPPKPEGADEGLLRGLYRFAPAPEGLSRRATIIFSGSASQAALEAQELLAQNHDVGAEMWSATSYKALREDALAAERHNRLHPGEPPRTPYVTEVLANAEGPIVAVTDYMKAVPDQVARWAPPPFITLGTDGFGRSDTRQALRRYFETDAAHIVVAVLDGLRQVGEGKAEEVDDAIRRYGIDPDSAGPAGV